MRTLELDNIFIVERENDVKINAEQNDVNGNYVKLICKASEMTEDIAKNYFQPETDFQYVYKSPLEVFSDLLEVNKFSLEQTLIFKKINLV